MINGCNSQDLEVVGADAMRAQARQNFFDSGQKKSGSVTTGELIQGEAEEEEEDCCGGNVVYLSPNAGNSGLMASASRVLNGGGTSTAQRALGVGSILYGVGELAIYNKEWGYWLGKNGKYYTGFTGQGPNGWTGSRGAALAKSNLWKVAGKSIFVFASAISVYEGSIHLYNRNYSGAATSALDITMGRVGFMGPWGAATSATYFGFQYASSKRNLFIHSEFNGDYNKYRSWRSGIIKSTHTSSRNCFISGTKIHMSDGSLKNIELIRVGDIIKTYNFNLKKIEDNEVLKVNSPIHELLIKIFF